MSRLFRYILYYLDLYIHVQYITEAPYSATYSSILCSMHHAHKWLYICMIKIFTILFLTMLNVVQ
jgi:hypothetical protein